jgi:hypothetical protein
MEFNYDYTKMIILHNPLAKSSCILRIYNLVSGMTQNMLHHLDNSNTNFMAKNHLIFASSDCLYLYIKQTTRIFWAVLQVVVQICL